MYHYSSGQSFKRITAIMMQSLHETARGISPVVFRNRLAPNSVQSFSVDSGFICISPTPAALGLGLFGRRTRDACKPSGQDPPGLPTPPCRERYGASPHAGTRRPCPQRPQPPDQTCKELRHRRRYVELSSPSRTDAAPRAVSPRPCRGARARTGVST